jgi:hypothetical protein
VLTVNQIVEILLHYDETKNWETAFLRTIPPRKLHSNDDTGENTKNNTNDNNSNNNTDRIDLEEENPFVDEIVSNDCDNDDVEEFSKKV